MTKIVWDGCDAYVEADDAKRLGYDFDGTTLYHVAQSFTAFDAVEIDPYALPKDADGEPVMDGVLGSVSGTYYRAI